MVSKVLSSYFISAASISSKATLLCSEISLLSLNESISIHFTFSAILQAAMENSAQPQATSRTVCPSIFSFILFSACVTLVKFPHLPYAVIPRAVMDALSACAEDMSSAFRIQFAPTVFFIPARQLPALPSSPPSARTASRISSRGRFPAQSAASSIASNRW